VGAPVFGSTDFPGAGGTGALAVGKLWKENPLIYEGSGLVHMSGRRGGRGSRDIEIDPPGATVGRRGLG